MKTGRLEGWKTGMCALVYVPVLFAAKASVSFRSRADFLLDKGTWRVLDSLV